MNTTFRTLSLVGLLILAACAGFREGYPPATNPFLAGAPSLETVKLPPTRVALIWLEPAGTPAPVTAQRALAEKIKNQFLTGKRLEIVGAATIPAVPGDVLSEVRKTAQPFNVQQVLVVMPRGTEVTTPVRLQYGRDGSAIGTRTDSYTSLTLVGVDLASGKSLYSLVANGDARLLKTDYEDARPWYPRISPGLTSSAYIYPERSVFPPGEVHAVALEQAVNKLIYELDRAVGS